MRCVAHYSWALLLGTLLLAFFPTEESSAVRTDDAFDAYMDMARHLKMKSDILLASRRYQKLKGLRGTNAFCRKSKSNNADLITDGQCQMLCYIVKKL